MIWKKIRGFFGETEDAPADEEPRANVEQEPEAEASPSTPDAKLLALAEGPLPDPALGLELGDAIVHAGRPARALEGLRVVLDRFAENDPARTRLVVRAAELLSSRGDDAAADVLLEPLVARLDAPLGATMLAAEIAERGGDATRALGLSEKVIARDLDFPRARERIERLRELASSAREGLAGMTLATEGALTRGRPPSRSRRHPRSV